jgi:predicted O-methyltransferase YrrM
MKGRVKSVDLNPENVAHANSVTSDRVTVKCQDSVEYLLEFENAEEIDLLYLDSFDFDPTNPIPSQLHHLKEISAIYDRLKPGCLVLVDDAMIESQQGNLGKASLVGDFFARKGVRPIIHSYQMLWVKP